MVEYGTVRRRVVRYDGGWYRMMEDGKVEDGTVCLTSHRRPADRMPRFRERCPCWGGGLDIDGGVFGGADTTLSAGLGLIAARASVISVGAGIYLQHPSQVYIMYIIGIGEPGPDCSRCPNWRYQVAPRVIDLVRSSSIVFLQIPIFFLQFFSYRFAYVSYICV